MNDTVIQAINARKQILFDYDDLPRVVEPHAFGLNKNQNPILRAYQVGGDSATNKGPWKLLDMTKAQNLRLGDDFAGPRDGYKPGDKAMTQIFAELAA